MAKGENIFKRKDGRWEARYIKGHEVSGKIKYGFCYGKTYKEAKEKVTKCRLALATGTEIPKEHPKAQFQIYCDEWLQNNKNHLKESTYIKYEAIVNRHINAKLGKYHPMRISTTLIEAFTSELLTEDGLSPKTVKDILVVLRAILNYTAKRFPNNFSCIEIHFPKDVKKEMRVLSQKEQINLIDYLLKDMDTCKFGVLLALLTGMRLGEICALRWENISLEEKTLKVSSTMQRLRDLEKKTESKTRVVVGTPKTDTSIRIIPMTNYAVSLCQKMHIKQEKAYVLTGTENYMEPRTLQYRFARYTKECDLEGVHFHTLRHTFATRCVEVGFEIKSLSEILGHANTSITLNRYVHSSMELKRNNMNKLSGAGWG